MANRWHSWSATAPLWGTGLIMVAVGLALIWTAKKQVR